MVTLRRAGCTLIVAGVLPLAGCERGGVAVTEPRSQRRDSCAVVVPAGDPAYCESGDGRAFIVHLPANHGFRRKDRVLLSIPQPPGVAARPAALAVVQEASEREARVKIIGRTTTNLVGARARLVSPSEARAPLGKYVAKPSPLRAGWVRLEVGRDDGVAVGDLFQVQSGDLDDIPVAQLRVVRVGSKHAWAELRQGKMDQESEQIALWERSATEAERVGKQTWVVVVNFDPVNQKSALETQAGQGFAKSFANHLANAADKVGGIQAWYDADAHVSLVSSDPNGHAAASEIGRELCADIIVWGAMRCDAAGCAAPRFTVVNPAEFTARRGADLWFTRDSAGFNLKEADAEGLATAILGVVTYEASRFNDAAYYLQRALGRDALAGEEALEARWKLARSQAMIGDFKLAEITAKALVDQAQKEGKRTWVIAGYAVLSSVEMHTGRISDARAHIEEIRSHFEGSGTMVSVFHNMALLDQLQGKNDDARGHFNDSRRLAHERGDASGEAAALKGLGDVAMDEGHLGDARVQYEEARAIQRRLGDELGESSLLNSLALLAKKEGKLDEARSLYEESLVLTRRLGLHQGELSIKLNMATLDTEPLKLVVAIPELVSILREAEASKDISLQATCHHWLALAILIVDLSASKSEAIKAIALYRELGDEKSAREVDGILAIAQKHLRRPKAR